MNSISIISFIYVTFFIFSATCCSYNQKNKDTTIPLKQISLKDKTDTNYKGLMFIPEQLALCVLDSSSPREASKKMKENYQKILLDVEQLKAEVAEQPGCIFYSTSPEKIVFETFMILKKKLKGKPKHSTPVILESTLALLYDHYGAFNTIHESYKNIENIIQKNGYKQIGPTREIYILHEDTSKWRTRIIVPVIQQ